MEIRVKHKKLAVLTGFLVLLVILPSIKASGDIHTMMDLFDEAKVRAPYYVGGVTYEKVLANPQPDIIFSFAKDNWAYAEKLIEDFGTLKKFAGRNVMVLVAMNDGSFVAVVVDLEEKKLEPGYFPDVKNRLVVTQDFLAAAIIYMETATVEETKDFLLAAYDIEWYAIKSGIKLPHIVVVIFGGSLTAAILAMQRRRS